MFASYAQVSNCTFLNSAINYSTATLLVNGGMIYADVAALVILILLIFRHQQHALHKEDSFTLLMSEAQSPTALSLPMADTIFSNFQAR